MATPTASSPSDLAIAANNGFRTLSTWLANLAFVSAAVFLGFLVYLDGRFEGLPEAIFALLAVVELLLAALLGMIVRLRLDLAASNPAISRLLLPIEMLFARVSLEGVGERRTLAKTVEIQLYAFILGFGVALTYTLFFVLHVGWLALGIFGFTLASLAISLGGLSLIRDWLWQNARENVVSDRT